jgi:hypothetical protein
LDDAGPNTERPADLHDADTLLPEAQDARFQLGPAHAPALFICTPLAILLVAAT